MIRGFITRYTCAHGFYVWQLAKRIIPLWEFLPHPIPPANSLLNNNQQSRFRFRIDNRWFLARRIRQERTGFHPAISVFINPASFGWRLARIVQNDTGVQDLIDCNERRVVPKLCIHGDEGGSWIMELHDNFSVAVCFDTCECYLVFRRDGPGWWLVFVLTDGDPHLPNRFSGSRVKKADSDRSCWRGTRRQTHSRKSQYGRGQLYSRFRQQSNVLEELVQHASSSLPDYLQSCNALRINCTSARKFIGAKDLSGHVNGDFVSSCREQGLS